MRAIHLPFVLEHLKIHHSITPLEALSLYGCYRLAAVIYRLRERGYRITTEMRTTPDGITEHAVYHLES